jgi:V/A-type H+-transporting ATPase subunit A
MFSIPEKQIRILKLMMDFYAQALEVIKLGAPLLKIRELECISRIVRIKSNIPNDKLREIDSIENSMNREFDEIRKEYQR